MTILPLTYEFKCHLSVSVATNVNKSKCKNRRKTTETRTSPPTSMAAHMLYGCTAICTAICSMAAQPELSAVVTALSLEEVTRQRLKGQMISFKKRMKESLFFKLKL